MKSPNDVGLAGDVGTVQYEPPPAPLAAEQDVSAAAHAVFNARRPPTR